jgi:hypothetical protein
MVDLTTRLMMVQPDALHKVITQAKYFVPTAIGAALISKTSRARIWRSLGEHGQKGFMQGSGGTGSRAALNI